MVIAQSKAQSTILTVRNAPNASHDGGSNLRSAKCASEETSENERPFPPN